jgi:hypothetical protein
VLLTHPRVFACEGALGVGGCVWKLLHAPPAFACSGAWVVAGRHCCTHPLCLHARVCRDGGRGQMLHAPPTRLRARGCQGGESGVDHLTALATPPIFRAPAIWGAISGLRVRRSRDRSHRIGMWK